MCIAPIGLSLHTATAGESLKVCLIHIAYLPSCPAIILKYLSEYDAADGRRSLLARPN